MWSNVVVFVSGLLLVLADVVVLVVEMEPLETVVLLSGVDGINVMVMVVVLVSLQLPVLVALVSAMFRQFDKA